MSYGPPVLNQMASLWIAPRTPLSGAADVLNIPAQLYIATEQPMRYDAALSSPWTLTTMIKVSVGSIAFKRSNIIAIPQALNLYYLVVYCETLFRGFGSQYDAHWVFQCNSNGSVPRTY